MSIEFKYIVAMIIPVIIYIVFVSIDIIFLDRMCAEYLLNTFKF